MRRQLPVICTLAGLSFVVAACGEDAAPATTSGATTVPTIAASTIATVTTTLPPLATTLPASTTTTLGTGTLIDPFDGSTPAAPWFIPPTELTWDLGVSGFLTIGNTDHPEPGIGHDYALRYPRSFRDGIVTMRFRPGAVPSETHYLLYLWTDADLSRYVAVGVTELGMVVVEGITAGEPPTQQALAAPDGTFDPAGFNELRVQAFDGVLTVSLNGIVLGEVVDPVPIHEGQVGFGFRSYSAGSEMTIDEFRVEPEVP